MGLKKFFKFKSSAKENQSKADLELINKKAELIEQTELELRRTQREHLERLNSSFNQMVDKLESIGSHLEKHIAQQADLLERFDVIPELTERQTELIAKTHEQIESQIEATEHFTEMVKDIPHQAKMQREELGQVRETLDRSCGLEESLCAEFAKLNIQLEKQGRHIGLLWILIAVMAVLSVIGLALYIFNSVI